LMSARDNSTQGVDFFQQLQITFKPTRVAAGLDKLSDVLGREAVFGLAP
jgi:hypothetical protein